MTLRSRFSFALHHLAELVQPARPWRDETAAGSPSTTTSCSPSSAAPSCVILGAIPRVSSADLPWVILGAILSLAAPPRVTLLTIARRLFPDGVVTAGNFPSVRAVEPSASLLLLHAKQGRSAAPTVIDRPDCQALFWAAHLPGYFVLDAAAAAARALPEPELVNHPGNVGILASPAGDGHYVVAELQHVAGSEDASLLCFSSRTGAWTFKDVLHPLPHRLMAPNGVVAHRGRLWWVDLAAGLVACDPFADAPVLAFVPLPPGSRLPCREAWGVLDLDRHRAVAVSAGELRFVDYAPPKVTVWTLADDPPAKWTREHEASFADIWAHPSYKAAGLPEEMPVLAVVHPQRPYVVYFFLEEHLFGVDLRDGGVVECEEYELVAPPREHVGSRFVHAWQLPRAMLESSSQSH